MMLETGNPAVRFKHRLLKVSPARETAKARPIVFWMDSSTIFSSAVRTASQTKDVIWQRNSSLVLH